VPRLAAIDLNAFQNASSRLTLVLRSPIRTERLRSGELTFWSPNRGGELYALNSIVSSSRLSRILGSAGHRTMRFRPVHGPGVGYPAPAAEPGLAHWSHRSSLNLVVVPHD
jgi:hypothetical protein